MGRDWLSVYVHPVLPNGLDCSMMCLGLLVALAVVAVLIAKYEAEEDKRIAREIEDDYNYFLQTGDDAGYLRRVKK